MNSHKTQWKMLDINNPQHKSLRLSEPTQPTFSLYSKELAFKLWIHCKPQPTSLEWWDGYHSRWPVCTLDLGEKNGKFYDITTHTKQENWCSLQKFLQRKFAIGNKTSSKTSQFDRSPRCFVLFRILPLVVPIFCVSSFECSFHYRRETQEEGFAPKLPWFSTMLHPFIP